MTEEEHWGGELMNEIKRRDVLLLDLDDQSDRPRKAGGDWATLRKQAARQPLKENHLLYYCVFPLSLHIIVSALKVLSPRVKETAFI